MELSPVIAPLSQAFIKCERGWLLCTFFFFFSQIFSTNDFHCFVLSFCEPYNIHVLYTALFDVRAAVFRQYLALISTTDLPLTILTSSGFRSSAETVNNRYSGFHWPFCRAAIIEQSQQCWDAPQYIPVLPKREENKGKLTVTMASTPPYALWTISSLLKAHAIKSISAPFHIPDRHTNCRIKHRRPPEITSSLAD